MVAGIEPYSAAPVDEGSLTGLPLGDVLERYDERSHLLAAVSFEGTTVHENGRHIFANDAFARMFGLSREEVVGITAWDLAAPESKSLIQERIRSGSEEQYEVIGIRKDGTRFPLEVRGRTVVYRGRTLRVTALRDVSDRKQIEDELVRQASRQRALLAAVPDLLFRLDGHGAILDFQGSKGTRPHVPPADFLGRPLTAVLPREVAERGLRAIRAALRTGEMQVIDYRLESADGAREYEARIVVSGAFEVMVLVRDFTEERRAAEVERQARTEAEAAVRARDEFLSIAAHELRTPVTAIRAVAQLLAKQQARQALDEERLLRFLKTFSEATERLATIANDLVDVSRLHTGRLILNLGPVQMDQLVVATVERFHDQVSEQQQVRLEYDEDCTIQGDADRLEQVLQNLLANAARYSPDGGEILVSLRRVGRNVVLSVQDHGIGLPAGASEAIFEPFGRAANASSRQIQGLGLGLYISRSIVERHRGRIWAESDGEGKGTTFSVWLPANAEVGQGQL